MSEYKPMSGDEIRAAVLESLKGMGVEMLAVHAGARDKSSSGEKWECDAWHITFTRTTGRIAEDFDYYTGIGHRKAPKIRYYMKHDHPSRIAKWVKENSKAVRPDEAGVLYSLLSDTEADNMSFNEWCDNYGYDSDSMKAFNTYQACCNEAKKVYRLFSRTEVEALRELLQDY